jgi:hypothetical protein
VCLPQCILPCLLAWLSGEGCELSGLAAWGSARAAMGGGWCRPEVWCGWRDLAWLGLRSSRASSQDTAQCCLLCPNRMGASVWSGVQRWGGALSSGPSPHERPAGLGGLESSLSPCMCAGACELCLGHVRVGTGSSCPMWPRAQFEPVSCGEVLPAGSDTFGFVRCARRVGAASIWHLPPPGMAGAVAQGT